MNYEVIHKLAIIFKVDQKLIVAKLIDLSNKQSKNMLSKKIKLKKLKYKARKFIN